MYVSARAHTHHVRVRMYACVPISQPAIPFYQSQAPRPATASSTGGCKPRPLSLHRPVNIRVKIESAEHLSQLDAHEHLRVRCGPHNKWQSASGIPHTSHSLFPARRSWPTGRRRKAAGGDGGDGGDGGGGAEPATHVMRQSEGAARGQCAGEQQPASTYSREPSPRREAHDRKHVVEGDVLVRWGLKIVPTRTHTHTPSVADMLPAILVRWGRGFWIPPTTPRTSTLGAAGLRRTQSAGMGPASCAQEGGCLPPLT